MPTYTMSYRWRDAENRTKSMTVHYDQGDIDTIAEAQAIATAYEAALEATSGCVIDQIKLTVYLNASQTANPDQGYYVTTGAHMSFRNSDGASDGFVIPGILMDKVINEKYIDPDDTQIAALVNLATGGTATPPISTFASGSQFTTFQGGEVGGYKVK